MSVAETFKTFLSNIAVDNAATISLRYGEITCALNQCFRSTDSKTANSLQVGSYGRWTAIKGISDLDMLYIMPAAEWDTYRDGGQYDLLRDTADAIGERYPTTDIKVDRLVVRVLYKNFHVEVQPVFENGDGSFDYPDTYSGGSWKTTKPREEIQAMLEADQEKNKNLRRLCKMVRAWKNKHGVAIGGLLIDTFAYNFMMSTEDYDDRSYLYYDWLGRDFFKFMSELPDQEYFLALGSGQRVKVKKKFQKKAKKAYQLSLEAIAAEEGDVQNEKWRKIYGRAFPLRLVETKSAAVAKYDGARDTEQYIEDSFPIDVRADLSLECEISQNGFRQYFLRELLAKHWPLWTKKSLRFFVKAHDISGPFDLYWKVLNRGPEAVRRDLVRGQILDDAGKLEKIETTDFKGDHVVEAYAVQNGVVVATDRIHVPIRGEEQE